MNTRLNYRCVFSVPWVGKCSGPATKDNEFCKEHGAIKCHCGRQAVTTCDRQVISLMCGAPLCGQCSCVVIHQ